MRRSTHQTACLTNEYATAFAVAQALKIDPNQPGTVRLAVALATAIRNDDAHRSRNLDIRTRWPLTG